MLPASCSARLHGWQQSVIGSAVGAFPAVTVDMDGQPRPGKKAKGADEFSAEPVAARLLSATDVGPNAPQRRAAAIAVLGPIIPRGCRRPP
jgi:hypothetical protein